MFWLCCCAVVDYYLLLYVIAWFFVQFGNNMHERSFQRRQNCLIQFGVIEKEMFETRRQAIQLTYIAIAPLHFFLKKL